MRKNQVVATAEGLGLTVIITSPGDGARRYCFGIKNTKTGGYRDLAYTVGLREAWLWLHGYEAAKTVSR
jgi:hypothetical protein